MTEAQQSGSSKSNQRVSFLGMGIMGSAMAFNLLKGGVDVKVWNRSQSRAVLPQLEAAGATIALDLEDCLKEATVVFTCLGDEQDVLSRLTGAQDSLLAYSAKCAKGCVVVDFSTIGPEAAQTIASGLAAVGVAFLDAPVTGGDVGAKNGTLTIMVGGEKRNFDQLLPLLKMMGENIHFCGPSGSGQALKLCNQVLCAVNMISVCESFKLAQSLGLDPTLVVDVLQSGAGGSWALTNLGNRILQEDLEPAFSLRNMLKDLRLVFESIDGAESGDISAMALPGTHLSRELFARVAEESREAPDQFGTQAMIRAYPPNK